MFILNSYLLAILCVFSEALEEYRVQETVLIESPFKERTRRGGFCGNVILAITPDNLIVASRKNKTKRQPNGIKTIELCSLYPLSFIDLSVFKRKRKQLIKVAFNNVSRYFELRRIDKRKVFWRLWGLHVEEIRRGSTLWPYLKTTPSRDQTALVNNTVKWNDKYLYLGAKRAAEDQVRPTPIPGLGRSDEIKLLYLKPQYFGCWDQAEHWVQCDESEMNVDYDVFTYTGVPTSNVTYTSLTTTLKVLGKQNA